MHLEKEGASGGPQFLHTEQNYKFAGRKLSPRRSFRESRSGDLRQWNMPVNAAVYHMCNDLSHFFRKRSGILFQAENISGIEFQRSAFTEELSIPFSAHTSSDATLLSAL